MSVRQKTVDLSSVVSNPGGSFEVTAHDETFPVESFTNEEAQLFENQFNDLIADLDSSILTQIYRQRQETIAKVAAFAKQELDSKVFGGVNAKDNQIGFDVLRPGHIYQDSGGTIQNDWYFSPGSTGWNDWIGDGSSNDYTVNEDQVTVILGFLDQDVSTEVSGLDVESLGRNMDMLPHDLNSARLGDNETDLMVTNLPTLIARDNDNIHIQLRHDRDAESQPRLVGFTFGLGSYLNTQDY